jgi:hypothetical protein
VALASSCGSPAGQPDSARRTGVWLFPMREDTGSASPAAVLLATAAAVTCVLAAGDGCLYAGGELHC